MGNQVSSGEVPTQFCNSIWEKLNAVMCNGTSINETNSKTKAISIFPNPANTEINIVLPSNDNAHIEISNAMGQVIIKDQNKNRIDISNLTNGLYFISVKQGQQSYTQKLIKQ
jgi:aminopeptidase YwaD